MVYLVDTLGILGSGQSPRFTVSESRGEKEGTPHTHSGETNQQGSETHYHVDTEPTVRNPGEGKQGGGRGVEGPPRGWRDKRTGCSPRPQGRCFRPKPCQGQGLTHSRSFCKPHP